MRRLVALGLLCACGSGDELPSQVSGTLGGVQMVLGGASWAWVEPRVAAGNGAEFKPYTLRLEMTGARFEVTAPLDTLPLEERHQIAAQVALADRLSFALSLPVMGDEIEGGARYETSDGDGVVALALGSRRDEGEPATADSVQPQSIGKDRGWALSVESISQPTAEAPGRLKGTLQLAISRRTQDPSDSLTGDLNVTVDVPVVGSWLGQCQTRLLSAPEGQTCPR